MADIVMVERLGVSEDVIKESCTLALKASRESSSSPFILHEVRRRYESVTIIAFRGCWSIDEWRGSPQKIDPNLFPSLRSIGSDKPALVHGAFLRIFLSLLDSSDFKHQVNRAVTERRLIVFTGHSAGGAIAMLVTIWLLEEFRKLYDSNQNLTFCLTFGSPLIGDVIFGHAVRREDWSRCFLHFVLRYDVVPRVTLAPLQLIEQEFQSILLLWKSRSPYSFESIAKSQNAVSLICTVMRYACTVASRIACLDMGSTNTLMEEVSNFIELSPYRPFGTYIFSTSNGRLVRVQNPNAVLHLMYYSLQLGPQEELVKIANRSLKEHLAYEPQVQGCLEMHDIVSLDQLHELSLSTDDQGCCNEMQSVSYLVMKDLGLSTEAWLCLRAAGESEVQVEKNMARIQANYNKIQEALDGLRRYKSMCELRNVGYYDAFKLQRDKEDFNANLKRYELSGLWDEILEMLMRDELPDGFECRKDWVRLGTSYRQLVEPLDIANYYRHQLNDDAGPYMIKGRPNRYKFTQRWLEHACKMIPWSSLASCFWAKVEELCILMDSGRSFEEIRGMVLELEQDILKWLHTKELDRDVFLESSTFVRWWRKLPQQHKLSSCIAQHMAGDAVVAHSL